MAKYARNCYSQWHGYIECIILCVFFPFVEVQGKKHLFSTGPQNSIRTGTIKENVMSTMLVEINKLWPNVSTHCRTFPNPNNGHRSHFTSFLTQKQSCPPSQNPILYRKNLSFQLTSICCIITYSPPFMAKFNVTTKESKLDDSHMY